MTRLRYEIIRYPRKGLFGMFAKSALIVATVDNGASEHPTGEKPSLREKPARKAPEKARTGREERTGRETAPAPEPSPAPRRDSRPPKDSGGEAEIFERFFDEEQSEIRQNLSADSAERHSPAKEIEDQLKHLIDVSCFDIDVVEVDVVEDTAYIFLDGEDAALIIGKEGYRYNALSYLLYNWIHSRYQLYIKLEIARFLASQQEMIRHYIQPVIEHVRREGWGKTRTLDGILVQIALEQLREEFPDKYVAIKRARDGSGRYILINEFNKRR